MHINHYFYHLIVSAVPVANILFNNLQDFLNSTNLR